MAGELSGKLFGVLATDGLMIGLFRSRAHQQQQAAK
jgi:hypothetical protein